MSELDVIKSTKTPNTVCSMVRDLKKLGLREGDAVLVHASMSKLGWVCGDEAAVIEALLRAVGPEGTVCMPAHSGANSDPAEWENPPVPEEWIEAIRENMPPYDPEITPTRGIGRVAEFFRRYPGTKRSDHPQLSFTANGKLAERITKTNGLFPQLGFDSPLGKLYELDAKVLFLGTGYDTCTCFHLGEALNENMPKKRMGAAIQSGGVREWHWFEDFDYDSGDFDALGEAFEKQNEVLKGLVGNAECRLFNIKEAVDFAKEWIKENRGL
jgi:aminoglycoside 3-N-acetyltransferase